MRYEIKKSKVQMRKDIAISPIGRKRRKEKVIQPFGNIHGWQ